MIKDIDSLSQPIINIYSQIELDLIKDIARRFDVNDEIGGTMEWQLKKLDELGMLNSDTVKTIARYSDKSEAEIYKMLEKSQFANINMSDLNEAYKQEQIAVNPANIKDNSAFAEVLALSYKELSNTYRLIQTKALESAKQAYMNVINRSYIEVATGTYDYQTAIKRAIKDMAKNGISGATYKRNGKLVQYSLEGTVRRDTLTAVNKLANKSSETLCKELGAEYVEISSHLGARTHPTNPIANHAGWQGKVFKIDGSDKKYPNLKESTGYPDDILGLGGVNCRHRMFPFFPGISTPNPIRFNEEENRRVYELTQKQRAMERRMRQLKKEQAAAKEIGDKETAKELNKKISEQSTKIDEFCKKNGLRRDHSRELVKEQITPKKNVAKSENSGIINIKDVETVGNSVHNVCKIDKELYSCVTSDIQSDDVIITDKQIVHIMERHPHDYERYCGYIEQIIQYPDYILEANKPNTAFVLKHIEDNGKNYELILRLCTSEDPSEYKNSVITFLKVEEKRYNRYLRTKKILYKAE